ncbi:MAG: site-2 protease family protein [Chloroflexi bacterium]|nr:site-2 protease family protein [Chloroflexota bacterium]
MSFPTQFDPISILATLIALIVGISVHEFSHAWSANALGDPTARQMGRLSLNPMRHFDPVGFFMLLLLAFGFFGIAWGRPVPINPYRLRGGRRGVALTSLAGPISNLFVAGVFAVPLRFVLSGQIQMADNLATLLVALVSFNILLAAFNLIPIPPLDGFGVLEGIVPNYWVPVLEPIRQYGVPILLGLIFLGPLLHINVLGTVITPIHNLFMSAFLGIPM